MPTSDEVQNAVQNLYRSDPEREWQRMERHRTEFAVTLRALDEHLPAPPARILDCGGGPGRYSIALAQRGYDVTLFDLSPELLAMAREKTAEAGVTLSAFEQGTATDLSRFPDDTFDAVLVMGPLYHLLDEAERRQALAEARRVVKPGGPVFAAFIGRYAAHRDAAANYPEIAVKQSELYNLIAEVGWHPPPPDRVSFVAYFTHPTEVEPLCRSAGLDVVTVLGAEGIVSTSETTINALEGEAWDYWLDVNYAIAHDPYDPRRGRTSTRGLPQTALAIGAAPDRRAAGAEGIACKVVGGTGLALRGLPVPVNDIDLEMAPEDTYRFEALFAENLVESVALCENAQYRSHFGRFDFDGIKVEVMGGLQFRKDGRWKPSFLLTEDTVDLDGVTVRVPELEETALAYLRRGRLDRAALCLAHCDAERFQALHQQAIEQGMF